MPANPLRVAHVDDDEDLRVLVRMALESSEGCTVASCASGSEALDVVPGFAPHILLVDMRMPDMDGVETVRALGDRMPMDGVTVVFATGVGDDDARLAPLLADGAAMVSKPFDAFALADRLRRLREG